MPRNICMPNLSKLNQILLEFNIELRFSKIEVVNFILIIFLNLDNFGAVLKDDFSDAEQRRPCVSCSLSSSFRGDFSSQSFVNKIVFYKKCEFLKLFFFLILFIPLSNQEIAYKLLKPPLKAKKKEKMKFYVSRLMTVPRQISLL